MSRPLIYYAIALLIGLISSVLFLNDYFILGAVMTASFLWIFFITIKSKLFYIMVFVYIIGFVNMNLYYKIPKDIKGEVRIIEKRNLYSIGEYKNKKYCITGNLEKIKEGQLINSAFVIDKNPVYSRGFVGEIKVTNIINTKDDVITKVYEYREGLFKSFQKELGTKYAAIVSGICFGDDKYISDEDKEEFNTLGIIHVISVSGFHIMLIYKLFQGMFSSKFSLLLTLLFVCFTGGKAPTLRAFIMIMVISLSKRVYKKYDALSSLSFAIIIILSFKPFYITDLGFNLSWISTLGIVLFNNKLSRYLYKLPTLINKSVSLTLSAQSLSFPYVALTLKVFSPGFLLGNFFIIPLYSFIIYISFAALIFIKVNYIFSLINRLLLLIFKLVDIWTYILISIAPEKLYANAGITLMYTIMFITILLYKKGFNKAKYLPLFILISAVLWDYHFIPVISVCDYGSNRFIKVSYKDKNYLFTAGSGDKFRERIGNYVMDPMVINIREDEYTIYLHKKQIITINSLNNSKSSKEVELSIKSNYLGKYSEVYDIINMRKEGISFDYSIKEIQTYIPLSKHIFISGSERGTLSDRY